MSFAVHVSKGPQPGPELDLVLLMRNAAARARRVYPGPAGQVLARELNAWAEMGWRYGGSELMRRLARDILTREEPKEAAS